MFDILKKLFRRRDNKIMLGRWGNTGNNIKNIYANHDNCGDLICKNPSKLAKIIKKEVKKDFKYTNRYKN